MSIKITVSGKVASGKTTLVEAIFAFLKEKGFTDVSVNDVDLDGLKIEEAELRTALLERRLAAIKDRSVVIEGVQIQRDEPSYGRPW